MQQSCSMSKAVLPERRPWASWQRFGVIAVASGSLLIGAGQAARADGLLDSLGNGLNSMGSTIKSALPGSSNDTSTSASPDANASAAKGLSVTPNVDPNAPLAWIDDISGAPSAGVDVADTLNNGQTIDLGGKGLAKIGYFADCHRETITGGHVTIHPGGSEVSGGRMTSAKIKCSGGAMVVASNETEAATATKRLTPFPAGNWAETTVVTPHPTFRWHGRGSVMIHVLDADAQDPKVIWTATLKGDRGVYKGPALTPGKPYIVESQLDDKVEKATFSFDPHLDVDDALHRVVVLNKP